jgi:hypothetical protein
MASGFRLYSRSTTGIWYPFVVSWGPFIQIHQLSIDELVPNSLELSGGVGDSGGEMMHVSSWAATLPF